MHRPRLFFVAFASVLRRVLVLLACAFPLLAAAQTLSINNDIQTYATLSNISVTLAGKSELRITGSGDPIPGCVINLTSADAWLVITNVAPSQVVSTFLNRVQVNGAVAVVDSNVRVVQHGMGAVVIPQGPAFAPMEVFDGKYFTGASRSLRCYVAYNDASLGSFKTAISSFRLKRGHTATVAQNENGTGISMNYVAQDGDLEVSLLPSALDNKIRFIRIFPWRWTGKKGIAGNIASGLNERWDYNWNLDRNSTRDVEYVPIRQLRWWPGLDQNWQTRGANHLLGYNEPDQANQANIAVGDAIWSWPDLLSSGLRLGAPAVSDGGLSWLYSFIDQADAAGLRVDFVPVHYYRSYSNAADPDGATTQFYNFLKGVHDRVKRPLWVTEWNNGANWTSGPDPTFAQQQGRVDEFLVFNQVLNDSQIAGLVNGRAPSFNADPISEPVAIAGQAYEQTIAGSASDPDAGSTLTYRKVIGPEWLTVAADGRIFGVPPAGDTGVNRFVVRVTDETLLSDDAFLTISLSATELVARYQFDGNAADDVGGGVGVVSGGPSYGPGVFDRAIRVDGVDDFVRLPAGVVSSLSDITIAARVRWDGGANWQRVFDFGNNTTQYMHLTANAGSGVRFAITTSGFNGEQRLNAAPLPVGEWCHVAVTLIGNTGTLYVGGVAVASNTAMTINPSDFGPLISYIGKSQTAADPPFNGLIDDLRIYSRGLSGLEIQALANPPAAVSVSDTSYAAWSAGTSLPQGLSGALADPDEDGWTNAWEYLFGSNPMNPSGSAMPQMQVFRAAELGLAGDKSYLTLQARVKKRHLGATLVPEAASAVEGLVLPAAASHAHLIGAPIADGEFEILTFYYDVAIEDSPTGTGAMRLRLNLD